MSRLLTFAYMTENKRLRREARTLAAELEELSTNASIELTRAERARSALAGRQKNAGLHMRSWKEAYEEQQARLRETKEALKEARKARGLPE